MSDRLTRDRAADPSAYVDAGYPSGPPIEQKHLLDYVRVIYKERALVATVFLLVVSAVAAHAYLATPRYQARVQAAHRGRAAQRDHLQGGRRDRQDLDRLLPDAVPDPPERDDGAEDARRAGALEPSRVQRGRVRIDLREGARGRRGDRAARRLERPAGAADANRGAAHPRLPVGAHDRAGEEQPARGRHVRLERSGARGARRQHAGAGRTSRRTRTRSSPPRRRCPTG